MNRSDITYETVKPGINAKVRCINCHCVLLWWAGKGGKGYWKHCTGWRTPKACKNAVPDNGK